MQTPSGAPASILTDHAGWVARYGPSRRDYSVALLTLTGALGSTFLLGMYAIGGLPWVGVPAALTVLMWLTTINVGLGLLTDREIRIRGHQVTVTVRRLGIPRTQQLPLATLSAQGSCDIDATGHLHAALLLLDTESGLRIRFPLPSGTPREHVVALGELQWWVSQLRRAAEDARARPEPPLDPEAHAQLTSLRASLLGQVAGADRSA